MSKAGYTTSTAANVALVATTAKTVLGLICPSSFGIDLVSVTIGFDGVTSTDKAVLCEIMTSTLATNSTPGTNNTTGTVTQVYGRSITAGFTSFYGSTSEPTVLTLVDSFTLSPVGGLVVRDFPLGQTLDTAVSAGIVLRCTAPTSAVNVRASFKFERC